MVSIDYVGRGPDDCKPVSNDGPGPILAYVKCHDQAYNAIRWTFFTVSLILVLLACVNFGFVIRTHWKRWKELNIRTRNHVVVSGLLVIGLLLYTLATINLWYVRGRGSRHFALFVWIWAASVVLTIMGLVQFYWFQLMAILSSGVSLQLAVSEKWLRGGKIFLIVYLTILWSFNTILAIVQPFLYSNDQEYRNTIIAQNIEALLLVLVACIVSIIVTTKLWQLHKEIKAHALSMEASTGAQRRRQVEVMEQTSRRVLRYSIVLCTASALVAIPLIAVVIDAFAHGGKITTWPLILLHNLPQDLAIMTMYILFLFEYRYNRDQVASKKPLLAVVSGHLDQIQTEEGNTARLSAPREGSENTLTDAGAGPEDPSSNENQPLNAVKSTQGEELKHSGDRLDSASELTAGHGAIRVESGDGDNSQQSIQPLFPTNV